MIAFLATVPLFAALGPGELRRVAEISVVRGFDAGDVVFREGDPGDTCYVVWTGSARAVREDSGVRKLTLASFSPRDVFGELALFENETRSATVEASDDLRVIALLGGDMRRLMRAHPQLTIGLLVALGRRLRTTNDHLARQAFQGVQSRVANAIVELVRLAQADGAGEVDVRIVVTHAELANLAGCARESVSRFLAALERSGVITQGRGRLTVHKPDAAGAYIF
jgi:CRP/FNR family transcriptional regulator